MNRIRILLLASLLTPATLLADPRGLLFSNDGIHWENSVPSQWEFFPEAASSPASLERLKPRLILMAMDWHHVPEFENYYGPAWYRLHIRKEANDLEDYAIYLPFMHRSSRVYFNETLIFDSAHGAAVLPLKPLRPTVVGIRDSLWRIGDNTISIQTDSMDGWGGFRDPSQIDSVTRLSSWRSRYILYYAILSSISIFLAIYYLLHYLSRRKERYFLFFAGLSLALGFWTLGIHGTLLLLYDRYFVDIFGTYLTGILVSPFLVMFVADFLAIKKRWGIRIVQGFYAFLATFLIGEFLLTGGIRFFNLYLFDGFAASALLSSMYALYLGYRGVRERRPHSRSLLIGLLVFFPFLVESVLAQMAVLPGEGLLLEGYFALIVAFSFVMARRASDTQHALEEAHGKLLTLDRLKDDFLANTSHELRTPLNGIINIAESLIRQEQALSEDVRREMALVAASGRRLSGLVNDILDFERIRQNTLKIRPVRLDLKIAVDEAMRFAGHLSSNSRVQLRNSVGEIPLVYADEDRVQQILINLIANALKFTTEGEIEVSAESSGDQVHLLVRDTGPGIPPEKREEIFQEFVQLEESLSRSHGGLGLGLSISRRLARLMSGDLMLRSTSGEGSTFLFTLPAAHDQSPIAASEQSGREVTAKRILRAGEEKHSQGIPAGVREVQVGREEEFSMQGAALLQSVLESARIDPLNRERATTGEANFSGRRILVVDDDPLNLHAMRTILESEGLTPILASGGEEALDLLLSGGCPKIDLMLLDIMMPRVSGYDVLERMKQEKMCESLPVVLVTARNRMGDLLHGLSLGATDFLTKPVDRDELVMRIRNILLLLDSLRGKEKMQYMEKELEVARAVQEGILATGKLLDRLRDRVDVGVRYLPMNGNVGGDYYHFLEREDGSIAFMVADAAGHGIHAALSAMQMDIANRLHPDGRPHERILAINETLQRHSEARLFFTGFLMDLKGYQLRYSSAGHPPQYLLRPETGEIFPLKNSGLPMGIYLYHNYSTVECSVRPGDVLVFYTDGLTENVTDTSVEIDDEKFLDFLKTHMSEAASVDPGRFVDSIIRNMKPDLERIGLHDDVTLVVLRIK